MLLDPSRWIPFPILSLFDAQELSRNTVRLQGGLLQRTLRANLTFLYLLQSSRGNRGNRRLIINYKSTRLSLAVNCI